MLIGHIFNEVNINNNQFFLKSGCFDIDYIEKVIQKNPNIQNKCHSLNQEAKTALKPIENKSVIDVYDNEKIENILKNLPQEIYLINGDFFGIQHFIFSNLSTKKAAKILRARSAIIQLITKAISMILEKELNAKLVLFGAGKFLMISKKIDNLKEIQKELNNIFFKKYFGESGIILSYIKVYKEELQQNNEKMKTNLQKLTLINEKAKYQKFKENIQNPIINIFENAKKDDEICEFCKKRIKIKEFCEICENEVKLATLLTKKNYLKIEEKNKNYKLKENEVLILEFKNNIFIANFSNERGDFDISNSFMQKLPKWPLKAYVPTIKDRIKTFEEIENNSSGLMALKADVDNLGKTFKDFYFNSFKKFNRLSREINFFFANYVPYLIKQKYKDIYIVFAGGDDLFIIGKYDTIVEFAKDLREKFYKFSLEKVTLSMGLVMFKSNTPISYVSKWVEEAEKKAKEVCENGKNRNGICIFDIAMKFDEFLEIEKSIHKILSQLNNSVLYKLIEIIKMAKDANKNAKNALWISKLFYLLKRRKISEKTIKELRDLIKKHNEKILPSLYLHIYKRRDNV